MLFLQGIEAALKGGCKLHAFLSGGGLRVVRLEKRGKLKGYGEHYAVEEALAHADVDYMAGGRKYDTVYGGSEPHYLTGSSMPSGPLDAWLLHGRSFDAWSEGAEIVARLNGYAYASDAAPPGIHDRVRGTGVPESWEHRGYVYSVTRDRFPGSGAPCTVQTVVSMPARHGQSGTDSIMYHIAKTGRGEHVWAALGAALEAEAVEVEEGS